MDCSQCHIYSIALAASQHGSDLARLLSVYHVYHRSADRQMLSSFRCLECGTSGAPTLPLFRCAVCAGPTVAVGDLLAKLEQNDEETKPLLDLGFAQRLESDVEVDVLRETLRMNGLPETLRSPLWKLLLGYCAENRDLRLKEISLFRRRYSFWVMRYCQNNSHLTEEQESTRQQISVDVPRTQCKAIPAFFEDDNLAAALNRVLMVTSFVFLEREGYFQGLGDVAMILFIVFCRGQVPAEEDFLREVEADVCSCLYLLLEPVLRATRGKFNHAVEFTHMEQSVATAADPQLSAHLSEQGVEWMFFAFRLNVCFLARELPLPLALMLWDFYLVESARGFAEFHPFVVVALMRRFRSELLACQDATSILLLLQSLPVSSWGPSDLRELVKVFFFFSFFFFFKETSIFRML